jgi:predicted SAM-dependent methyltransferase
MFPSETSTARPKVAEYCKGIGVDIGFGGDKISRSAWAFDMPRPYTVVGADHQQLRGDCRDLSMICDSALDYIYSSHLIEDFSYEDICHFLLEWRRVLKDGGNLVINCPDQQRFMAHCHNTGQALNPHHIEQDFSLETFRKLCLEKTGLWRVIYEDANHGPYSFLIVASKLGSNSAEDLKYKEISYRNLIKKMSAFEHLQAVEASLLQMNELVNHLQTELKDKDARTAHLEAKLNNIYTSSSWWVTKPLRWVINRLKQLKLNVAQLCSKQKQ